MRRQKKALRFFLALALFLFMFSGLARAEEAVEEPYALEDFNMEEIQRFLDSLGRDQDRQPVLWQSHEGDHGRKPWRSV